MWFEVPRWMTLKPPRLSSVLAGVPKVIPFSRSMSEDVTFRIVLVAAFSVVVPATRV